MIPKFPNFKKVEISDKDIYERYTQNFPPYSDFNFISFFTYDDGDNEISLLNDNLVIKLPDYLTNNPTYTFLGKNKQLDTTNELLDFVEQQGLVKKLKLIPEDSISNLLNNTNTGLNIVEDPDNHDYILSVELMSSLEGPEARKKRNYIRKFEKEVKNSFLKDIDISHPETKREITELCRLWSENKKQDRSEAAFEISAITRIMDYSNFFNLISLGLYSEDRLIAFSIHELPRDKYSMGHFRKADISYPGVFSYIDHKMAQRLKELGTKYLNFEQDLGVTSMRSAKLAWHPVDFLKKYTITLR